MFAKKSKTYVVIAPVVNGEYLRDEVVTAAMLGKNLKQLVQQGSVREQSSMQFHNYTEIETLIIEATKEAFAQHISSVVATPKIFPESFDASVRMHRFPVGNGYIMIGSAVSNLQIPSAAGIYTVIIHTMYDGATGIPMEELQSYEPTLFYILPLDDNHIKVQARCNNPYVKEYFHALLSEIQVFWADRLQRSTKFHTKSRNWTNPSFRAMALLALLVICIGFTLYAHEQAEQYFWGGLVGTVLVGLLTLSSWSK